MKTYIICATLVICTFLSAGTRATESIRYAFYDANGKVVQTITGPLTDEQLAIFLRDYVILFHAVSYSEVGLDVHIGDGASPSPTDTGEPVVAAPSTPSPSPEQSVAPCLP
jgi:hypothetical protein